MNHRHHQTPSQVLGDRKNVTSTDNSCSTRSRGTASKFSIRRSCSNASPRSLVTDNDNKENVDPASRSTVSKKTLVSQWTPAKMIGTGETLLAKKSLQGNGIRDEILTPNTMKTQLSYSTAANHTHTPVSHHFRLSDISSLTDISESKNSKRDVTFTPLMDQNFDPFDEESSFDAEVTKILRSNSFYVGCNDKADTTSIKQSPTLGSAHLPYRPPNPTNIKEDTYDYDTVIADEDFFPNLSIESEGFIGIDFGTDDPFPINVHDLECSSKPNKVKFNNELNISKYSLESPPLRKKLSIQATPRPVRIDAKCTRLAQCPSGTKVSPLSTSECSAFESARKKIDACATNKGLDLV